MGVPPVIRLRLLSDDASYRESVTDAVNHCPDIELTATATPDKIQPRSLGAPADCILLDADTDSLSLPNVRDALRTHHPTLPVLVATTEPTSLSPSLSTHGIVTKPDVLVIAEVARIVTTTTRRQPSLSVSTEQ
ncbi:MAG: hypothetical protein J07HN4v3_02162 [Halonotius sp. J07HN4]|nr:MAG: hypothetical protein J07HN4v3_02162 [Halonotius sp. J07HN4]